LPYLAPFLRYWKQVQFGWDAVNTYWSSWVIDYNPEQQQKLLYRFGIGGESWKGILEIVLMFAGFLGATFLMFFAKYLHPDRQDRAPVQRVYTQFCRKLARVGLPRRPGEGPLDYAAQVTSKRKDLTERAPEITDLYIHLR
jgi:hypothetical protein